MHDVWCLFRNQSDKYISGGIKYQHYTYHTYVASEGSKSQIDLHIETNDDENNLFRRNNKCVYDEIRLFFRCFTNLLCQFLKYLKINGC